MTTTRARPAPADTAANFVADAIRVARNHAAVVGTSEAELERLDRLARLVERAVNKWRTTDARKRR